MNLVTVLSIIGLFITLILIVRNIKGALFIGMFITAIIGYFMGMLHIDGIVSTPPNLVFFDLDITGVFSNSLYAVVFSFLLVTIFDTTGTMIGVAEQAGLNERWETAKSKICSTQMLLQQLLVRHWDQPIYAYIESSSGVAAGGRSGLTAFVVAILFLAYFILLAFSVSHFITFSHYSSGFDIVGCYMMEGLCVRLTGRNLMMPFLPLRLF